MTPWAHLQNAHHIDWVISQYAADPEPWAPWEGDNLQVTRWAVAWEALHPPPERAAAYSAAWGIAWQHVSDGPKSTQGGLILASFPAVRDAIRALVVADYAGAYMDMPVEAFRVALAADEPAAVLMARAVRVRHGFAHTPQT